jgi:DNA-binding transcriptional ArsR family regulator
MEGASMRIATDQRTIDLRARLFHGLAEPSRQAILEALRDGPRNVGEIAAATGLSQSNASNHLACLLGCGLVAREQQGKFAVYALADREVGELLDLADALLAGAARGVATCRRLDGATGA